MAIFNPFNIGIDLCGRNQPAGYLLNTETTYIVYPEIDSIGVRDVNYNSATLSFRLYGSKVVKTFDQNILKVNLGTAKLPMGSLVNVFKIEFIDGKIEYFDGFDFQKLYRLPDGVFDINPVCSK